MSMDNQAMPDGENSDEPRLPLQPMGASLSMAASMMRSMPVFGPGIAAAQDEFGRVENLIWREIRQRIENGADPDDLQRSKASKKLSALLTEAVEQSAAQAREHLIVRILDDIEPDEARILAALSDGTTYPLLHVVTRTSTLR